jgi:hypothetical protein
MAEIITTSGIDALVARLTRLAAAIAELPLMDTHVTSSAPYAGYVIGGTRAHDIYPRDKQALFWPGARHPVTHVHHPGTKGNDFPAAAARDILPAVSRALEVTVARAVVSEVGPSVQETYRAGMDELLAEVKKRSPVKTGRLRDSFTVEYTR